MGSSSTPALTGVYFQIACSTRWIYDFQNTSPRSSEATEVRLPYLTLSRLRNRGRGCLGYEIVDPATAIPLISCPFRIPPRPGFYRGLALRAGGHTSVACLSELEHSLSLKGAAKRTQLSLQPSLNLSAQ